MMKHGPADPMPERQHARLIATLILLASLASLIWCVVDSAVRGARVAGLTAPDPVLAGNALNGVMWLVGHGFHGATALALPLLYLSRRRKHRALQKTAPAQERRRATLLAAPLFLALLLSFLWCIVDDIPRKASVLAVELPLPPFVGSALGGVLWVNGHGFHSLAVIALPMFYLKQPWLAAVDP